MVAKKAALDSHNNALITQVFWEGLSSSSALVLELWSQRSFHLMRTQGPHVAHQTFMARALLTESSC